MSAASNSTAKSIMRVRRCLYWAAKGTVCISRCGSTAMWLCGFRWRVRSRRSTYRLREGSCCSNGGGGTLPLRAAKQLVRQQKPGDDEGDSAEGCDGSEEPDSTEGERVEAAREQYDSGEQQGTDAHAGGAGDGFHVRKQRDNEQAERVDEVIKNGAFVDGHRIVVEPAAQAVRSEGAGGDRQGQCYCSYCAPVHYDTMIRCPRAEV